MHVLEELARERWHRRAERLAGRRVVDVEAVVRPAFDVALRAVSHMRNLKGKERAVVDSRADETDQTGVTAGERDALRRDVDGEREVVARVDRHGEGRAGPVEVGLRAEGDRASVGLALYVCYSDVG